MAKRVVIPFVLILIVLVTYSFLYWEAITADKKYIDHHIDERAVILCTDSYPKPIIYYEK